MGRSLGQRGGALPGHDSIASAKEGLAFPPDYGARSTAPAMTSWGGVWDSGHDSIASAKEGLAFPSDY